MGRLSAVFLVAFLASACLRSAAAADRGAEIDSLLPDLASDDAGRRAKARQNLEKKCLQAAQPGGQEADRAALCAAIAARLGPETPTVARVWLLRQLEYVGGAEVVGALTRLLDDKDAQIRECARRALQNNPSPQAADALRKALERAEKPEWRVAMVNALGGRKDRESVGALVDLLGSGETSVVEAAAAALGRIGGPEAARALATARKRVPAELKGAVADAYLLCADVYLAEGRSEEAAAIYNQMSAESESKLIRIAALQGLAAAKAAGATGKQAPPSEEPAPRPGKTKAAEPDAVASWDGRLRAAVKKALGAGRKPSFQLRSMRARVRVMGIASNGTLRVAARGIQLGVTWNRLTLADKTDLALAVAGPGPNDQALAAFYLTASGRETEAASYLLRAGEAAKEVREAFE
jgi:hypothetical protein